VGSHMFSLTFTNSFGTTFAQVARGGAANTLFLTETDIAALCAWSQSEAARLVGAGS
jgi:hypothetical protein